MVYFAFPDGVLHYECRECTALCCRYGQGITGHLGREMGRLLTIYPNLAGATRARHGDVVDLALPLGEGCFFLHTDHRCGIEVEHGQALKPGACLLFPFNRLLRVGETIVVAPHYLCPLRLVAPARPGEVSGTHARIAATAVETQILASAPPATELHPGQDAAAWLAAETTFRDACAAALGRQRFAATLRAAAGAPSVVELGGFVERALAVLGVKAPPRADAPDELDAALHVLAPTLRLEMLALSPTARVRALALYEAVLRDRAVLLRSPVALQIAYQIMAGAGAGLRLLALGDEPLTSEAAAAFGVPAFEHPPLALAALLFVKRLGSAGPLRALEAAIATSLPAHDRAALLAQLGGQLARTAAR